MTITHSCCPEKRDIQAPMFEHKGDLHLSKHIMQEWYCRGCKTVIFITIEKEHAQANPRT